MNEGYYNDAESRLQQQQQHQQPVHYFQQHGSEEEEEEDGSERSTRKTDVQVVVEINNYRNTSRKHSSEEIDDNSISKSLDESISIIGHQQQQQQSTIVSGGRKTKIVAKVKPNPRKSITSVPSSASDDSSPIIPTSTLPTTTEVSTAKAQTIHKQISPISAKPLSTILTGSASSLQVASTNQNVVPITQRSVSSTNVPSSTPTIPSIHPAAPSPINLGATSPIFESGINTECIQLLRQLWNVHEELVDFNQQLLLILRECQQSVQYTLDLDRLDGPNGGITHFSSKKFKTSAFVAATVSTGSSRTSSPHQHRQSQQQQQQQETPTSSTATTATGDRIASALEKDNELIKQCIECPSVDTFIQGLKSITESVNEIERQYNLISICSTQCKLVLYAKVRHAKKYVIHDRFSVLYTIHRLILTMLTLLSSTTYWELYSTDSIITNLLNIFQLTEVYNSCLESTYESSIYAFNLNNAGQQQLLLDKFQQNYNDVVLTNEPKTVASASGGAVGPPPSVSTPTPSTSQAAQQQQNSSSTAASSSTATTKTTEKNKISILAQILDASKNDSPSCRLSLKPLSATKLLQLFAQKRGLFASYKFIHTIQTTFFLLGSGAHRLSISSSHKLIEDVQAQQPILSLDKFESIFMDEDSKLTPFAKCFSKCPSLLGRGAIKQFESGKERLSGSVRNKMYNYFRQSLWVLVGEIGEDLILWDYSMGIPLVLNSLEIFSLLKSSLMISKKFAETSPSPILPAIDSMLNTLNSFILLLSWDEKIQAGFELASKIKRPEQLSLVRNPKENEWATGVGLTFGEIITTCLLLMEVGNETTTAKTGILATKKSSTAASTSSTTGQQQQHHHPNVVVIDSTKGGTSDASAAQEEEPLCDEAQILFRIDATLAYYKAWVVKRCKSWLNSWSMPAFLACSQRDPALLLQLVKSHQTMFITRQIFLQSQNVSIRLSANHRRMCADSLQETIAKFQKMPDDLLLSSGPVCRMLSLATIQSYMPEPAHWRGIGPNSGLNPDHASPYVRTVISKVIEPVTLAAVEFVPSSIQEGIGKQVIQATCEAWLQYILQKKIKFSEWGALQLLRDFMTLRDWIRNESLLEEGARKALLQLEILKRCEGVAFLLLRNPGDVLGVGKPSRSTRRVAPSSSTPGSNQSSPHSVSESSVAEDDIPPEMYVPNQQIWLELRLRRHLLSSPCCQ